MAPAALSHKGHALSALDRHAEAEATPNEPDPAPVEGDDAPADEASDKPAE